MKNMTLRYRFTLLLLVSMLFNSVVALAQNATVNPNLLKFNEERLALNRKAMLMLGVWSVGNIALGLAQQGRTDGNTKYFHQMNAGWGAINLTIAAFGYYSAMRSDASSFSLYETMREQASGEKLFLFNGGLDVGYMLGGLYLMERSRRPDEANPERLDGFGRSVLLQGAFLFVFDLINYGIHNQHSAKLQPFFNVSANGLGLQIQF